MSSTRVNRRVREIMGRVVLAVLGLGLANVLMEAGLRWNYYATKGPGGMAQAHLYRALQRLPLYLGLSGVELNQMAWEATYTERGQPVPPVGPREGYWGVRTRPQQSPCGDLSACERSQSIPLLVEIDERGFQHVGERTDPSPHVLFVGGSVAFGAYASTIETTYFALLHQLLSEHYPQLGISVLARNGSVGMEAFALRGHEVRPSLVVFLNGLNDLTNQPNQDPSTNLRSYRRSVLLAIGRCRLQNVPVVFASQPFLGSKIRKTAIERRLLDLTLGDYEDRINPWYRKLIEESEGLVKSEGASAFLDYSDLLAKEIETTFADQWHFSDFGHAILAVALAEDLDSLLQGLEVEKRPSSEL